MERIVTKDVLVEVEKQVLLHYREKEEEEEEQEEEQEEGEREGGRGGRER